MLQWTTQLIEPGRERGHDRAPRSGPTGPCFIVSRRGHFRYAPDYPAVERCSLSALTGGYYESLTVFDEQGLRWRVANVRSPRAPSLLNSLLAHTVYNPIVTVEITWAAPEVYEISELRGVYRDAVLIDDDILTQFVDADELQIRIAAAHDFESMARTYAWSMDDAD